MFGRHSVLFGLFLAGTTLAATAQTPLRVRSVTAAVERVDGVPRLVLIARGPCAGGVIGERRHVVDPSRCAVHREAYRQGPVEGQPQWESRYHVVWKDGGADRVLGTACGVRDEMPGPGREERYELLSLPRAEYGFDLETGTFWFEPDVARAALRPQLAGGLAGRVAIVASSIEPRLRLALEEEIRRRGGLVAADPNCRPAVVVAPSQVDFAETRDEEVELLASMGSKVLFADELIP